MWKKLSISKKIFVGVMTIVIFCFFIFLMGQMSLFREYYTYVKTNNLLRELESFSKEYTQWQTDEEINNGIIKYSENNDFYIMIMGENGDLLHMVSYEMTLKTNEGENVRITFDNISHTKEFQELGLKKGDYIKVECREPIDSRNSRIYVPDKIYSQDKEWKAAPFFPETDKNENEWNFENKIFEGEIVSISLPSRQGMVIQRREAFGAVMDWRFRRHRHEELKEDYIYINHETQNSYIVGTVNVEKNQNPEVIFAISPMRSVYEAVFVSRQMAKIWIFAGIFMALIIAFILMRSVSKPILKMSAITQKMKNLDFSEKCHISGEDEIGMLARNINEMSDKLDLTIAELKAANEKLKEDIERERKLEQQRKDFVDAVSHELKTPLAVIQAYAEGIMDGISGENKTKYLKVILEEIKRMDSLVLSMLENSRLEAGAMLPEMKEYDLHKILRKVAERFEKTAEDSGVELIMQIPEEPLFKKFDITLIEQVISNFVINGIYHSEKCGKVRITAKNGEVSVENSGKNIPEEELDLIWDKFYKTDKSRTRTASGTGLGLSIAKNILNLHKADYGVENTKKGVKFRFLLK